MREGVIAILLFACGCDKPKDDAPRCAPGTTCLQGAYFADCAPGEPYFACPEERGCQWYLGCVPEGSGSARERDGALRGLDPIAQRKTGQRTHGPALLLCRDRHQTRQSAQHKKWNLFPNQALKRET